MTLYIFTVREKMINYDMEQINSCIKCFQEVLVVEVGVVSSLVHSAEEIKSQIILDTKEQKWSPWPRRAYNDT